MSGNKKIETFQETSLLRGWRRPTFPQFNAVSSARRGLTSLFGMGRGGPPCCSHHVSLSRLSCLNLDMALKESAGKKLPLAFGFLCLYFSHLGALQAVLSSGPCP